jgi:hypothetical protein
METDKFVVNTEHDIAMLMKLRKTHRDDIKRITATIKTLETNVRLRKVEILEAQKEKRNRL